MLFAAADAVDTPEGVDQLAILQVGFAEQVDPCECPNHNINCRNFDRTDRGDYPYDRNLRVGDVDHWRLVASFDGHPFHIHINPFVVCPLAADDDIARDYEPPFAHWRDTYQINLGRQVDLITEYKSYTGAFVHHCHKLTHEDGGMMELVRLCEPEEDCGPYAWDYCAEGDEDCQRALEATQCHFYTETTSQCLQSLALCRLPRLGAGEACEDDADCESDSCVDPPGPPPAACE